VTAGDALPKPDELLALHGVTTEMFAMLRAWFDVPDEVMLDLTAVDSAVREMGDPVMIAALAMRKLQALHLLSTPGVRTTTDVVVAIVSDLERALVQAPAMRLQRQAESTDWDAALAALHDEAEAASAAEASGAVPGAFEAGEGVEVDDIDHETVQFQALHAMLHDAVRAVLEASGGEIRYFE
jgi:hypothetical protein